MKTRLALFCIVGILIGLCAGVVTTVVGLEVIGDIEKNPELGQNYVSVLLKGAFIWVGFGLVNGVLLFLCSLGETPIVTDIAGRPLGKRGLEKFDYRRVGSKLIYICAGLALANCFWLIPFLSEPSLFEPRSLALRLVASVIISLTALIGTFMTVLNILLLICRTRL